MRRGRDAVHHWTRALASIAVSAAICLAYAVYDGFPFVYSDTGTYLASGWRHFVPDDRPITYGLFLRWTSLGATLWLPIAVQALITACAIHFTLGPGVPAWITPAATGILALTTGLAPHVGQLIPDIFTGLAVLTLARLLTAPSLTRGQRLGLGALLVLSLVLHMSHLLIGAILVLVAAAFTAAAPAAAARLGLTLRRSLGVAALVAGCALLVPTVHRLSGGGFVWSRFSHVFMMGRMAETGILGAFLDEACPTKHYRLCDHRAAFPQPSWIFIWREDSPLALTGGAAANRAEYQEIIGATLRRPHFLAMHLGEALVGAAEQLGRFQVPEFRRYGPKSPPYEGVRRFYPREFPSYERTLQRKDLHFERINAVQPWVVLFSLAAIGAALLVPGLRRRIPDCMVGWGMAVLLGVIANAVVCGALSSPIHRYGARVIWVIPLTAIALFATSHYGLRGQAGMGSRSLSA